MESEVKKRKAQLYKYQGIGFGICILGIIYLCCMIFGIDTYYVEWAFGRGVSFLLSFSIILVYALFVAAGCIVARRGGVRISEILSEECDPFLYEACISGRGRLFYRERVLCNLSLARYYQGNYDKAWETLKGIDPHKLRGIFKANFYILLSDLYFKRGMGMGVRGIEEEFRQSMKGKREQRYFEMLCAGNNLTRALENQDYLAAFGFLCKRMELNGNTVRPWMKVNCAMKEAQIYLGLGEKESARLCLDYVVAKGGRMRCVQEAEQILAGMENASSLS